MQLNKKNFWLLFFSLSIVVISLYWLKNMYHTPRELLESSTSFIYALNENQLENAYTLTSQKGEYFYSFSSFYTKVNKEFFKHIAHYTSEGQKPLTLSIEFKYSKPPQSYGNRLRRWFFGRAVDLESKSLEFYVHLLREEEKVFFLPFEVRWELQADDKWKIVYFQSHAI